MSMHGPGEGPEEYQRENPIPINLQAFEDRQISAYNNHGGSSMNSNSNSSYSSSSHHAGSHQYDGSGTCLKNGDAVHTHIRIPEPITTRTVQEQLVKHSDEVCSKPEVNYWKKPESRDWNTSSSLVEYQPNYSSSGQPDYFRRETAFNQTSGKFPVDNMQFETTFKKEVCESVTRY
jgi:hypothetical protein